MHRGAFLALCASLLACTLAAEFLDAEWQNWKSKHERKYSTFEEEILRRETWEGTWKRVMEHNKLADQGKKSYTMAMNHFADRTLYEMQSMSCLHLPTIKPKSFVKNYGGNYKSLPQQVDWRDENCVTDVKNQGDHCGSCWAFATAGALESRYCIKTKELIEMSEQELVDCDELDDGCCGGFPYNAFMFIVNRGIMPSSKYQYKGRPGNCRFKLKNAMPMNMSKVYRLEGEENMAAAVGYDGPITVGFAVEQSFFFYNDGIYDDDCAGHSNHAIIIVGYGAEEHEEYWIIKNSWGPGWGDQGYGKVRRNVNKCNIGEDGAVLDLL